MKTRLAFLFMPLCMAALLFSAVGCGTDDENPDSGGKK